MTGGPGEGKVKLLAGLLLPFVAIILAVCYLIVRTLVIVFSPYLWYEIVVAWLLLFAETFILIHGIGYFLEIIHVLRHRRSLAGPVPPPPPLAQYPPVAIIVSSFKEPLEVLENTLISFYNLTYPNKRIYFLDDTRYDLPGDDPQKMAAYREEINALCRRLRIDLFRRRWRGAKAGMVNDFLDFVEGRPKEGFEFTNFSGRERGEKEKYIIVFDADMNPLPNFVEPLVAKMEADPRLAFIQTPQYYTNFEKNRIARAAGLQQAVFYEYICEGKSLTDAMFCCGTNVIFRREALMDVGGFDESSVTEDFATSLKFHLRGWRSAYHSQVLAFGMGPEDLGGYFKQQFRWALGTVGLLRQVAAIFLRRPGTMAAVKWWEYFLSSTHYFIGLVFFILALCPILYLFFSIPAYFARPEIYLIFFLPYIVMTASTFYWTLRERRYRPGDLVTGQLLLAVTFPIYMKASILGILGFRGTFVVTPKGGSTALPLKDIWPQLTLAAVSFAAVVWGINRLLYEGEPWAAIAVNMFWAFYHFVILASVLYFNEAQEEG
ncbi:MAG TPA: glycosyltransferase family 2 protein [Syntrophales bacterium]|nr:glycosyltransferase family 2 protein [Syntrophales bacterium]HOM06503.1 glycosyltransferase family 2 protein [Syntrophales bacterium]HON99888.1 glycosyltransferase family 2 protein [Syntrophales bacterium]HPC01668.1 glycosyltransferase family 2 protein [Syntrophales bacterium]HPQ06235.1 glycosyltransferase family 2 protein [Syntrophales bacterium]